MSGNLYVGLWAPSAPSTLTVREPLATRAHANFGYQGGVGTLNVSGSGTFSNQVGGNIFVGNGSGSQGYLNVSGSGTYFAPIGQTLVGYNSDTGSMTIQDNASVSIGCLLLGPSGSGTLTMTGGSLTLNPTATGYTPGSSSFEIGEIGTGTANISGGNVTVYGRTIVGSFGTGAQGHLTLSGNATMVTQNGNGHDAWNGVADDGWVIVGTDHYFDGHSSGYPPGAGTLTVTGNASLNIVTGSGLWLGGFGGTGTGVISGSATVTTDLAVVGNQSNFANPGLLGYGYLTIQDQGVLNAGQLSVGTSGSIGQVNLLGGVCEFGTASGTAGTMTVNTGTIKALASNSSFISSLTVFVNAGGTTINSNGFDIGMQVPLRRGSTSGGGLTRSAEGVLA